MCITLNLSEKGRNRLGIAVAVFNAILFLASVALILAGIYIQIHVHDELILLESYNSGLLPNFIVSIGSIMFLLNLVCAKIAYDSGFDATREKFRMTLVPLVVLMLLTSIVLMSSGILCLSYRSSIEDALHDGLMDSMKRYKENINIKITLDKMQMFSKCCGSRSYRDWFIVSWIANEFVDTSIKELQRKMIKDQFYSDTVPFSCCDAKSNRPCVTNRIQSHMGEHKPETTLHSTGCTERLADEMENTILKPVGIYIMAMFGVQLFATFLLRYLQTSIEDSYLEGNTLGPGKAYFCPNFCPSCLTTGDPNKYIKKGALDKGRGENGDSLDDTNDDTNDTVLEMGGAPGPGDLGNYGDINDIGGGAAGGGGAGGERGGHDGHKQRDKSKERKSSSKSPKKSKTDKKPKKSKSPKKPKAAKKPKSPKKPKASKKRK